MPVPGAVTHCVLREPPFSREGQTPIANVLRAYIIMWVQRTHGRGTSLLQASGRGTKQDHKDSQHLVGPGARPLRVQVGC